MVFSKAEVSITTVSMKTGNKKKNHCLDLELLSIYVGKIPVQVWEKKVDLEWKFIHIRITGSFQPAVWELN